MYTLGANKSLPALPDTTLDFPIRKQQLVQSLNDTVKREQRVAKLSCEEFIGQRERAATGVSSQGVADSWLISLSGGSVQAAASALAQQRVVRCTNTLAQVQRDGYQLSFQAFMAWNRAVAATDNATLNAVYDTLPLSTLKPILLRRIDAMMQSDTDLRVRAIRTFLPSREADEMINGLRKPLQDARTRITAATSTQAALEAWWKLYPELMASMETHVFPAAARTAAQGPAGAIVQDLLDEMLKWLGDLGKKAWNWFKMPLLMLAIGILLYGGYRMYMSRETRLREERLLLKEQTAAKAKPKEAKADPALGGW